MSEKKVKNLLEEMKGKDYKPAFKYLLLVYYSNGTESYYADDPDKLKEYAEYRKFNAFDIYELKKSIYSYREAE